MSETAKQEKQEQFQAKLEAYQRRLADFNREIQQKQREMVAEYSKKVQDAAQMVAQKDGYTAIIDKGNDSVDQDHHLLPVCIGCDGTGYEGIRSSKQVRPDLAPPACPVTAGIGTSQI